MYSNSYYTRPSFLHQVRYLTNSNHLNCFHCRKDQRSPQRKTSENNRNLTLLFAQIAFMILSSQHNNVAHDVCQAFGALTHVLYLSFFAWTGWCIMAFLITHIFFITSSGGVFLLPSPGDSVWHKPPLHHVALLTWLRCSSPHYDHYCDC